MPDHFPCIDLAEAIDPEINIRDIETFNSSGFAQSTAENKACRAYIRWCILRSKKLELIDEYELEDPCEHLLLFFENGGEFSIEHGWLADVVGCGGFDIRDFDGTLASIWTQGNDTRAWRRVMDWIDNL